MEDAHMVIEEIKVKLEVLKHQYDYFKNMTTITTGAFILIVAFMDRAFDEPKYAFFILVSLLCFSLSLLISLLVMKNYTTVMNILWEWNFGLSSEQVNNKVHSLNTSLKNQRLWCGIFFGAGIAFLLLFAGANILFETNIYMRK